MKKLITSTKNILALFFTVSAILICSSAFALSGNDSDNSTSSSEMRSNVNVKPGPGTNFTIGPNPAKDIIYANFWSGEPTNYTVTVYSMIGTSLRSKSGICQIGANSALIDMTGFAPGIYLIQINNHNIIYTGKVLMQ